MRLPHKTHIGRPVLRVLAALSLAVSGFMAPVFAATELRVVVTDSAGKPVPEALVYLTSAAASRAAKPLQNAAIAQKNKTFLPDVLVVTTGTPVAFPNEDTVRHHVYSFSSAKKFEIKLYVGTPTQPVVFDTPGIVVLGCNIHDHMVAWVVVVDTPYHGRTDTSGTVTLPALPADNYQLTVWHKGLPVDHAGHTQAIRLDTSPSTLDVMLSDLKLP